MREVLTYKRKWLIMLLPLSYLILFIARKNPDIVEHILIHNLYRWISLGINSITGLFPFSVGELLIPIILIIAILILIRSVIHFIKQTKNRKSILTKFILNTVCLFSVIFFIYTTLCKVNYYRYPISYYSGLTIEKSTVEELYQLCIKLADQANHLRSQIQYEDENGITMVTKNGLKKDFQQVSKTAKESYQNISKQYPILGGSYSGPKPMIFSELMSYMETTGIFFTFTMESNVNINVPEYTIPSTIAHELAHLRGFMKEDEANYIAYITCMQSDDIAFQYSGAMDGLIYATNQLYQQDKTLYLKVRDQYSPAVLRDLKASSTYWTPYRDNPVGKVADKINDTYLKSNNHPDGVKSYGQMVDLLLAEYRKENPPTNTN